MNRERSEHSWVLWCVCVCACMLICVSAQAWDAAVPPGQYLLSILRSKERELVSIFMDVAKCYFFAVFPKSFTVCAHKCAA